MKAISLWQPWASAMAVGLKTVETRHWSTSYRGHMAIHAAKRWTRDESEFAEAMGLPADLPLGAIVAFGELCAINRTETLRQTLSAQEQEWGNYADGRFGWVFANIVALPEPVPFRGAQGLFDIPSSLLGALAPAPRQRTFI
jgi:hypothetical protein